MKILVTVTYYLPYISGLTIHTERLVAYLCQKKYQISIITSQFQKSLFKEEKVKGVSVIRVPFLFRASKGFFMPSYIYHVYKHMKYVEVILINLPQFEGCISAILGRISGKRVICIYHCEVKLPNTLLNRLIECILFGSHIITLLCSHRIVTYTYDYAKHSKLLPFFSQKMSFIYPPIPVLESNEKIRQELRSKIPMGNKFVIGVAARIAAEKGIEFILESIPLIKRKIGKQFVIIFAGPKKPVGEGEYWKKISPLIEKYKTHILFIDTILSKEMGSFYSLLDVLILPSVNATEAFGIVQVEAMLCGIPVVASNIPGVRIPIQKTGMGELVKPKDSKDLASKIVMILTERKKYIKSKEFVKKRFSLKRTILEYEKVFKSIS